MGREGPKEPGDDERGERQEPEVGDTQAFPVPGATPPYPGWERATEPGEERREPPSPAQPSRYDPPTPPPGEEGAPERPARDVPAPPPAPEPEHREPAQGGYQPDQGGEQPGQGGEQPGQGGYRDRGAEGYGAGQEYQGGGYQGPGPYGGPPYPPQGYPGGPAAYGTPRPGGGLATASLVLGIVSLFLLFLCGLGVITAIIGIILGIIAVVRNVNKGRAWAGIILSVLAIILAAVAIGWFYTNFSECMNLPTQELAQRCVESKLGVSPTSAQ
jgi:hypothetical protein